MRPPKVTVAMLGARMDYAVARILWNLGQLQALVTDLYLPDSPERWIVSGTKRGSIFSRVSVMY